MRTTGRPSGVPGMLQADSAPIAWVWPVSRLRRVMIVSTWSPSWLRSWSATRSFTTKSKVCAVWTRPSSGTGTVASSAKYTHGPSAPQSAVQAACGGCWQIPFVAGPRGRTIGPAPATDARLKSGSQLPPGQSAAATQGLPAFAPPLHWLRARRRIVYGASAEPKSSVTPGAAVTSTCGTKIGGRSPPSGVYEARNACEGAGIAPTGDRIVARMRRGTGML